MLRVMYVLLFANYFLGGPEVLDLQFRNAQKEPHTLCYYIIGDYYIIGCNKSLVRFLLSILFYFIPAERTLQ